MKFDLYISMDVEADGPVPGEHAFSMLSLGACVAGLFTDKGFVRLDPEVNVFYREMQPISERFVPEALVVAEQGLAMKRDRLRTHGTPPDVVMAEFADWVGKMAAMHSARPVAVGWPVAWDFGTWVFWYLTRFTDAAPFSHGMTRDIRDTYCTKARLPIRTVGKQSLPPFLRSQRRHTHNALDDAIEQADTFANIMEWEGPQHD